MPGRFIAVRRSGPSVRRSKNRQPERSRNACISRLKAGLLEGAVGGGALIAGRQTGGTARRARNFRNGRWPPRLRGGAAGGRTFGVGKFHVRPQFVKRHRGGLDGAGEILADAPEIFPGQRADFRRRFFARRSTGSGCAAPRAGAARRASRPGRRPPRPSRATSVSGSACNSATSARAGPVKQRVHGQRKQILRTQS